MFADMDSIVGDAGGVYHTDDTETACLWGVWGKSGDWNASGWCSTESRCMRCGFLAVARDPEWGRAGDMAVIDGHIVDDMAGLVDV